MRRATGVRGHRYALVSLQFPGFNIVRLWRLTAGYLKEILEDLGRRPERHHVFCFFQAQTFEDSVLWEPRGTEVFAENRRRELRRSPLRPYADLIHAWGLRLFVVRSPGGLCGAHLRQVKFPFRFSPKNIAFRNSRFQDRASTKSRLWEAFPEMRQPSSKQFVHSFMHVLSQAAPTFQTGCVTYTHAI